MKKQSLRDLSAAQLPPVKLRDVVGEVIACYGVREIIVDTESGEREALLVVIVTDPQEVILLPNHPPVGPGSRYGEDLCFWPTVSKQIGLGRWVMGILRQRNASRRYYLRPYFPDDETEQKAWLRAIAEAEQAYGLGSKKKS